MGLNPKLDKYPVLLLAFSIPLPIRVTGFLVGAITLSYLSYLLVFRKFDRAILRTPLTLLLILSFIIIAIGSIWGNFTAGSMDLERGLFILCFPLIVYHSAKNESLTFSQIAISFFTGCFFISIVGWVAAFWSSDDTILREGHTKFTEIFGLHPTYLSIYFVFLFFFFLESIIRKLSSLPFKLKTGYIMALLYCLFMIFYLRSRVSMVIFVILLCVYFIIMYKKRAWLITFILFTFLFVTYLLDTHHVTTLFDRYGKNVSTALDNRVKLWNGVLEAIKISPIQGAGTGAEQDLINEGYNKVGYLEGIEKSYNAHNQYLQFWVRNGLIELAAFVILMTYLFLRALKMKSLIFLIFLMMSSMIMFTESFLNVQKGIVFFYFFICIFSMMKVAAIDQNVTDI